MANVDLTKLAISGRLHSSLGQLWASEACIGQCWANETCYLGSLLINTTIPWPSSKVNLMTYDILFSSMAWRLVIQHVVFIVIGVIILSFQSCSDVMAMVDECILCLRLGHHLTFHYYTNMNVLWPTFTIIRSFLGVNIPGCPLRSDKSRNSTVIQAPLAWYIYIYIHWGGETTHHQHQMASALCRRIC